MIDRGPAAPRRRQLLGALPAFSILSSLPALLARPVCAQEAAPHAVVNGGPYVPTPQAVVDRMLDLATVGPGDVVYDLGSGDGRLVVEAARRGATGVGVERDAELVRRSRAAAAAAGVGARTRFEQGDIFDADLREATVVTLYLLPPFLERLAPKLRAELRPRTRVVAHDFPLPGWTPERTLEFDDPEKAATVFIARTAVYLYAVAPPG